jgi:hypothetical protein
MGVTTDPKIKMLRDVLAARRFNVDSRPNEISIDLEAVGYSGDVVDFYVLKNNVEQVRARMKRNIPRMTPLDENDITKIHGLLQKVLKHVVHIDRFHSFGKRGDAYIYYAHVSMASAPDADLTPTVQSPTETDQDDTELEIVFTGLDEDDTVITAEAEPIPPPVVDSPPRQTSSGSKGMPANAAFSDLEGVDAKMFRKSLDTLGLSRSSLVRLALTRIFREASDTSELITAISREAELIIKEEDKKIVQMLKDQDKIPFLSKLAHLLWLATLGK